MSETDAAEKPLGIWTALPYILWLDRRRAEFSRQSAGGGNNVRAGPSGGYGVRERMIEEGSRQFRLTPQSLLLTLTW